MTLNNATAIPTIAVTDLEQGKRFYTQTLGLNVVDTIEENNQIILGVGNTFVCLHERPEAPNSPATVCSFEVDDVEKNVGDLRQAGLTFEEYDIPEMDLKTNNGIASRGNHQTAWFKDPFGNIIAIGNTLSVSQTVSV